MNDRGSAYAWAMFFIFMWIFATVWYFAISPLWDNCIVMANMNAISELPGASAFYTFYSVFYSYIPFLVFIFAVIGFLKYAATKRREGL